MRAEWSYFLYATTSVSFFATLVAAIAVPNGIDSRGFEHDPREPGSRLLYDPVASMDLEEYEGIGDLGTAGGLSTGSTENRTGSEGIPRLPQAVIIGIKKGGTRALLEFLKAHPDVRAPGPEIHFFDRHYSRGLDWYRSQMPPTTDSQVTIEKTPSYFVTKSVPARLYNMSADVKLIVVVRNPVTRAISDYTQAVAKRPDLGNVVTFQQMAFLDPNSTDSGPVATSWGAVKIGLYARHLKRWLRYFPIDQFHFVNGERLVSDPAEELGLLQDFLGIRRLVTDRNFYFSPEKGFPCLRRNAGTNAETVHCLGKTKGRTHPAVDEKALLRLRNFFRPFNEKFYRMTGIDFGWP